MLFGVFYNKLCKVKIVRKYQLDVYSYILNATCFIEMLVNYAILFFAHLVQENWYR